MKNNIIDYRKTAVGKLIIIFSLLGVTEHSIGQSTNEISFHLQGSFTQLEYQVQADQSKFENGFGVGARYAHYFSKNWSIGTGVELQYLEGSIYLQNIQGTYESEDPEGENFELRYKAQNFSENQYAYFVNLPLKIQYESGGDVRFFVAGGIKAGFLLEAQYETKFSELSTSGYYPQYDVELMDPQFAGFGEFGTVETSKSPLELKTNFILNLESGIKLMLENQKSLYMGLFIDYGLNNIQPEPSQERLINYNNQHPTVFSVGSVLVAKVDNELFPYADKVRTMVFGLKVQYAFQF